MNKVFTSITFLLIVFCLSSSIVAQSGSSGVIYKPVEGKATGIWPTSDYWTVTNYKYLKNEKGFSLMLIPAFENNEPALSRYYTRSLDAGYSPENLLIIIKDTLYQSIAENLPAAYYYLDEPVEHDCFGNPSNSYVSHIYSPTELRSIRDYIHAKQPNAEFVIGGYKRCSHFKKAAEIADRVMYSSYENWSEYGFLPICPVNLGWADDFEKPWENGPSDQSSSWNDMRNKFGSKFNMTWVKGDPDDTDDFNKLFQTANSLGLETVWFYGGSGMNETTLASFCEYAAKFGWLEKIDSTTIDAPAGLSAAETENGYVQLNWQDNSNVESGYIIMKKTGSGTYSVLANLPANATQFIDTATTQNTQYTYRIQAYNNFTESEFSNEVIITTSIVPIETPSSLISELDNNKHVILSWTDNSDNEDGFIIEKSVNDSVSFNILESAGANTTSFLDSNIQQNTQYFYRIKAFNSFTESGYSNTTSLFRFADPIISPSGLRAQLDEFNNIELTWSDNSDNESKFYIEKSINDSTSFFLLDSVEQNTTTFLDTETEQNTSYFYKIKALNDFTQSEFSNTSSIFRPADSIETPSDLMVELMESGNINLVWSDNSGNESGFYIEKSVNDSSSFFVLDSVDQNIITYLDNSTQQNELYFYRIKAYNSLTESDYSNTEQILIPVDSIEAPTNLLSQLDDTRNVYLSWSDNSDNENGFELERKLSTDNSFSILKTLGSNSTNYLDNSTSAGNTYEYRIKAYNSFTVSQYSNTTEISIASETVNAPTNLSGQLDESKYIILNWLDNSINETGFILEKKLSNDSAYSTSIKLATNSTGYLDKNVIAGYTYNYRIKAYNQNSYSEYSNEISINIPPDEIISPTNLQVSFDMDTGVKVNWLDNSNNEGGFIVERMIEGQLSFEVLDSVGQDNSSYIDSTVIDGNTYGYRVKAFNQFIHSGYTDTVTIAIPHFPISSPTELQADLDESGKVLLIWKDNSNNEIGFRIERKLDTDSSFDIIISVEQNITVFVDSTISDGMTYDYRVIAYNNFLNSGYTDTVRIAIPHKPIDPPTQLIAKINESWKVTLNWQDNSENEIGFIIEKKLSNETSFNIIDIVGDNIVSYTDTNVIEGNEYNYRLKAFNAYLESNYSDTAAITVPHQPVDAPSDLQVEINESRKVLLSWKDNSDNENGFIIEKKHINDKVYNVIDSIGHDLNSYLDTTVTDGNEYIYRLKAFNEFLESDYTDSVTIYVPHKPVNSPMELLADITASRKIQLIWHDNSDNESGFKIERKLSSDSLFSTIDSVSQNITTYFDSSTAGGKSYTYRVFAFNEFINSGYSNNASITTPHDPIASPTELVAMLDESRKVRLSWKDNSENENNFTIERKLNIDSLFSTIDTVAQDITSYIDSSTIAGKMYDYRIKASNEFVNSNYSNTAPIAIPFNPINSPTELAADLGDLRRVLLSWNDNSGNEFGFAVQRKASVDTEFLTIDSTGSDSTLYIDTTLTGDGSYSYRVFAFNDDTTSEVSNEISIDVVKTDLNDEALLKYTNRIYQNYPNPFNPSTTIKFSIAEDCSAIIKLFNPLGKEILTIFEGSLRRGFHEVQFNGNSLPSGVYFFRIVAGKYTDTKKLILLK